MKGGDCFGPILLSVAAILRVCSTTDDGAINVQDSRITNLNKVEIHGKVVWPDELATASQVQLVLLLDGGGRVTAWPKLDGSFVFYDVPAGPHMLETISTNLVYPQMHIDVDEDSGTFTATYAEQPSMGPLKPFLVRPIHKADYFEHRQPFNVIAFLKTPYGMMIAVGIVAVFILPKMKIDPEEYRELMEAREANAGNRAGGRREVEQRAPPQRITGGPSSSQGSASARKRRD